LLSSCSQGRISQAWPAILFSLGKRSILTPGPVGSYDSYAWRCLVNQAYLASVSKRSGMNVVSGLARTFVGTGLLRNLNRESCSRSCKKASNCCLRPWNPQSRLSHLLQRSPLGRPALMRKRWLALGRVVDEISVLAIARDQLFHQEDGNTARWI